MGLFSWLFGGSKAEPLRLAGSEEYGFDIVGESNYQRALSDICGGRSEDGADHDCEALLQPEPTNPHDKNAVQVFIEDRLVGYLSRDAAANYHAEMRRLGHRDGKSVCDAVIRGGWKGRRGRGDGHFGVKLDLDWPFRPE